MTETRLWMGVVQQAIEDACGIGFPAEERESCKRMAKAYLNSTDFKGVIMLAGMSVDDTMRRAHECVEEYERTKKVTWK